ncbi:MAG: DedA family protein [Candidatus Paceibacterota bacterium]|jgi:membrane-associated protein
MHALFDTTQIITTYGYIGIFIVVFLESGIFFLLPGDSLIFTAGLMAPVVHFNIVLLTLLVFLSAFLGGIVGYYIGTKIEHLRTYAFFRRILKQEHIDKAHAFFEKHGLSSMILSRFMPVVRTFLPIVAGIARMKYADFLKYSFFGALIWSTSFTLGGYYLGKIFPQLEYYLIYVISIIVILSILPGVIHLIREKYKSR